VWQSVSAILSDPKNLRAGLDEMIERERSRSAGDPEKETAALTRRLGEIKGRRARYQEMAAAGLVDFDELRERLAGLDEARGDAERAFGAARNRADQL
jgi:multidrug resistance efflux pump